MTPYYQKDNITIYNGDCLEVMPELDVEFDAVIADPPYGIDYQSARRTDKTIWKPKIQNDKKPFLKWGQEAFRLTRNNGCILIFYRWDVQNEFINELENSNWIVKSQIIWNKQIHGMGDLKSSFAPMHENILFAIKSNFLFPNRRPKSIVNHQRVSPNKLTHPNEKPISLFCELIDTTTNENDTILDFTFGSGTTLVAAKKLNRKAIGIEISKEYCDIAIERLEESYQKELFE